jgi:hypothetical protein
MRWIELSSSFNIKHSKNHMIYACALCVSDGEFNVLLYINDE